MAGKVLGSNAGGDNVRRLGQGSNNLPSKYTAPGRDEGAPPPITLDPVADEHKEHGAAKGYIKGHDHGLWKGIAIGAGGLLCAIVIAAVLLIGIRRESMSDDMFNRRVAVQEADMARMKDANGKVLDGNGNEVVTPPVAATK